MPNQPYIPIYIGDWERDTNLLTPLAEFALLKLCFKLFNAEKRGVFYANFRSLSVLFKSNLDDTKDIFQELIDNKILDISLISEGKFEIKSRRMLREGIISEIRAEAGKRGGEAKHKQKYGKSKAKHEQIPDTDNDIVIDNVIIYLNKVSGKNFQKETEKHRSFIRARIKENYSFEDFKIVIDIKSKEWIKTDFEKFIRPETLFGSKFDGYLNEKKKIDFESEQNDLLLKPQPVH